MLPVIKLSWALLVGIALIMVGNGLQTSLLGLRATLEGFPTAATGLVMSAFYVGFLAGSLTTPKVVESVGHIRVFAAWASMASAAILLHGLVVDPIAWTGFRFVTGFCYAGLYVVAESWLNERATNRTRGQLLSIYMVVQYVGLAAGHLLLNLASPAELTLFILTSVVISLALVPISLTSSPSAPIQTRERLKLSALFTQSPLGVITCAGAGLTTGALLGMGAVFAEKAGLSVAQISIFMTALIVGAVCLQFPLGRLSDHFERRRVIVVVNICAVAFIALSAAALLIGLGSAWTLALIFVVGGLTMPLYAIGVAYTNDVLRPEQMVAASSSLVLIFGLGASLGPVGVAAAMSAMGPVGFYVAIAGVHLALLVYALWRLLRRDPRSDSTLEAPVVRGGTGLRLQ